MTYRDPFFMPLHSWRAAGASAITVSSEATGFPKERLIDDQRGPLFKFGSASSESVTVDRGSGTLEEVDRLVIPGGHNLSGETLTLATSATGAFAGEETERFSITAGAGVIDESFTSTDDRYHRLSVGNFQAEIPEVFVGRVRTPSRGPDTSWVDDLRSNLVTTTMRSGNTYAVSGGDERRFLEYVFHKLSSSDLAMFTAIQSQTAGGLHPFVFWTADDSDDPVIVRLSEDFGRRQDSQAPRLQGQLFVVTLSMLEHIA